MLTEETINTILHKHYMKMETNQLCRFVDIFVYVKSSSSTLKFGLSTYKPMTGKFSNFCKMSSALKVILQRY